MTHNYVSGAGLAAALAFLGTRSADLVSGCEGAGARTGLHARFLAALQQRRPEVGCRSCFAGLHCKSWSSLSMGQSRPYGVTVAMRLACSMR